MNRPRQQVKNKGKRSPGLSIECELDVVPGTFMEEEISTFVPLYFHLAWWRHDSMLDARWTMNIPPLKEGKITENKVICPRALGCTH